jgi:putative SOS response-associated peptidase YedK
MNALPNTGPSWNVSSSQLAMVDQRHRRTAPRHAAMGAAALLNPRTCAGVTADQRQVGDAATPPVFRQAFAKRRALVPAGAFREWRMTKVAKQPFAIARSDGEPLVFAERWEGYCWPSGETTRSFCITTTELNALTVRIHDRMPVVLESADWPVWLGEEDGDPAWLLRPAADGVLRACPSARA